VGFGLQGVKVGVERFCVILGTGCPSNSGIPSIRVPGPLKGCFFCDAVDGDPEIDGNVPGYIAPWLFEVEKQTKTLRVHTIALMVLKLAFVYALYRGHLGRICPGGQFQRFSVSHFSSLSVTHELLTETNGNKRKNLGLSEKQKA
jgi:hypothetical protein